ncbi:hypothetical protein FQN51_003758 [Onygenales sp. PD_10]|nr:hypothetical protein FQN51_003758 [Onygenales sp. PD_10]
MRSKPSSAMQKTYDDCYLMCSTAVYFEGQNNEPEALRSWRSALDTIQHHNTYRMPANYAPKTQTEKALYDSLREMEMQCRERIDLLHALNESRKEAGMTSGGSGYNDNSNTAGSSWGWEAGEQETGQVQVNGTTTADNNTAAGWVGDGTVPSFNYSELSQPPSRAPPPVPARPSMTAGPSYSADSTVQGRSNSIPAYRTTSISSLPSPPPLPVPATNPLRTGSPERRAMLTTLRNKEPKKTASAKESSERDKSKPAAASRAAGLAWSSISRLSGSSSSRDTSTPPGGLKKSLSKESSSGRKGLFSHHSDSPRHTKTSYLSDYLSASSGPSESQSRNSQSTSNLATDAAATAINKPSGSESLLDLSEPSPPSLSRPTTNTTDLSPNTSATRLPIRPKQQSEYFSYIDDYPEHPSSPRQGNVSSPQNKLYPTSQTQASRNSSGEGYRPSQRPLTSSITPTGHNRGREPSHSTSRSPGADDALSGAINSMRTGAGHVTRTSQTKQPARLNPEPTLQPSARLQRDEEAPSDTEERDRSIKQIMKNLPKGVDADAARQILNDIVVRGDEVHWDDVAGLEVAKNALKEAVVYPFLRPDLFSGLREPARGMLLFGPPGTGKTMLARAVATESRSTFFSVSASSLTSKWHGESEKLVRALFGLAKCMAPSIIFVDEIDSLLSARSASGEAEASRRSKTEFLVQWSDLQRAAAGREQTEKEKREGDATRVLVLAATNLPWDIDEAARRRFVRRQYIPLPEDGVRKLQIERLLGHQKHELKEEDIEMLVRVTDGFSGSDITALAKDAAMGPLRNLGEALLHTPMDQIRPIRFSDFEASLASIRPSVGRDGLKEHEEWAKEFGERGG